MVRAHSDFPARSVIRPVSVDSIWDVDGISPEIKEVMENNLRAFLCLRAKTVCRPDHALQSPARPLLHSLDRDLGWGKLGCGRG